MYAEETVGFCLKFKGFTSSSHHAANLAAVLSTLRTLSFCSFCCENLLCTLPFSQAALSQHGTERGTSHRQDGAQPITSFAAFCMRQCASMCTVEMPAGSDIHSSPSKWLRCVPGSCKVARNARASPTVPPKKLEQHVSHAMENQSVKLQCDSKS